MWRFRARTVSAGGIRVLRRARRRAHRPPTPPPPRRRRRAALVTSMELRRRPRRRRRAGPGADRAGDAAGRRRLVPLLRVHAHGDQDARQLARRRGEPRVGLRRQVADGLAVVARNPFLRTICLESFAYNFFVQFGETLVALYALTELGLSAGMLGLCISVGSVGGLAGAVVAPRVVRRFGFGPRSWPAPRSAVSLP